MNYIELINNFWQKDIEFNFSDKEITLYFYLLKVSNSISWKNPFGLSNDLTAAKFKWGKSSFDTAKNNLKKAELIDFMPGNGRGNTYQYQILTKIKGTQKSTLSVVKGTEKGNPNDTLFDTLSDTFSPTLSSSKTETSINKNKKETKPNKKSLSQSGKPPAEVFPFFQTLVSTWFDFYQEKYSAKPVFTPKNAAELKLIGIALKKVSEEKNYLWNEEFAERVFKQFLSKAYGQSNWLKSNFLLTNLNNQFNSIINNKDDGQKQPGGPKINGSNIQSMFAKIDSK